MNTAELTLTPLQRMVICICFVSRPQGVYLEQIAALTSMGPRAVTERDTLLAIVQLMAWQLVHVQVGVEERMYMKVTRKGLAAAEAAMATTGQKMNGGGL